MTVIRNILNRETLFSDYIRNLKTVLHLNFLHNDVFIVLGDSSRHVVSGNFFLLVLSTYKDVFIY